VDIGAGEPGQAAPGGVDERPAALLLSVRRISKTFSGRTVLRDFALDVRQGEVHGLVGQNGSGKSTLIKILAGYYAPDPGGALAIAGSPVPLPLDPGQADALGLSFVHQDLGLCHTMTVLENLRVGHYDTGFAWRVRWRRERKSVSNLLQGFGAGHISPDALVGELSAVDRAIVAIVRALDRISRHKRGVLVLDEPTVYLPRAEAVRLFDTIRQIAGRGHGVIFVSHRLEEVGAITDCVTILRDGALIRTAPTRLLSERALLEDILGRELGELYPPAVVTEGAALMEVDLRAGRDVEELRLQLRQGEIIGLTGLLGMGQDRVPYLLFGAGGTAEGTLSLNGAQYQLSTLTPRRAIRAGLALLPADRLTDGSAQEFTVRENVTLPTISRYFSGVLRHGHERRRVLEVLDDFMVKPPDPDRPFRELSGGNQQKALVGKWFEVQPRVLLLHEPTQGVDVGARRQIFERICSFASAGGAVLIASVEYEDLAHLCDRVLVFRDGRVVSELRKPNLDESRIVEQCFRAQAGAV
jgi:ribose transport system ATP-binding protein